MQATFHRTEMWAECAGIRISVKPKTGALFPLCRAMVDAGLPDDAVTFSDETGFCFMVRSFHRTAKWQATENDARGPRLTKYAPNPLFQKDAA